MAHEGEEAEKSQEILSHDSRDFHHPYTPYSIQETFMSTVYQVLEQGKVGILESPTGTVRFSPLKLHVIFALAHGFSSLSKHLKGNANRTYIRASH
jgi:hypothetical protein